MEYEHTEDKTLHHNWVLDEFGNVDELQMDFDYHNGPRCKDCGRVACVNCVPNLYKEVCPGKVNQNEPRQSN